MIDAWAVNWTDGNGQEQTSQFGTYLEAWTYNEERLEGRGEVVLVTDRFRSDRSAGKSEAEAARRREGGRRWSRRSKKRD